MLRRFSVTLAQLTAVDNSEKPQNKTRELLYSFYRSKKFITRKSVSL